MTAVLPRGGGATGDLLRRFDWSGTSLGAIAGWPPSLRTSVDIVLNSPLGMVLMWGPEHVMLYNDQYAEIAGARHPAALGGTVPEIWPEIWDWNREILAAGLRGEVQVHEQKVLRLLRNDEPEDVCFDLYYTPVRDDAGAVGGVLCTVLETARQVRAARQLVLGGVRDDGAGQAADEERLRIAHQAGGVGSFEWFPESGRMLVSDTFRRIWGLADETEVSAALLVGLVDRRDLDKVGPLRIEHNANPLEYVEYRVRRPSDGAVRWIARQGEAVAGPLPGQRRYVGVSFDVTQRRQIEEALHASEERLAAIFGQASVGLSELGLDGRFQRVNGALCAMLGRTPEQLLALNMSEILHPDDVAGNALLFRRLVETGASFTLEKRYLKPDGSQVWVSSNVSRLVDRHGQPLAVIAVKTDITQRRRIEAALRELNDTLEQRVEREVAQRDRAEEALRQAQKMEAVGQLTGGIAHDFNNVLQIISGNLHLLYRLGLEDQVTRQRLETAIAAVERGAKLSSQLLSFARRQPLQPVVADLGRLVRNMDALLRRALGEATDMTTVVGGGLWNTQVDPSQLENVILNLAINARDAMAGVRGGGKLRIELGNVVLGDAYVETLVDVPAGQYVMLSIADNGCGMPAAVLQRAFEPFFTTKPEGQGTGLGLSMAYGFVTQSHGHIRIDSEPGQGTVVNIYLPRSLLAEQVQGGEADGGAVDGGHETILVVEDDAGVRATVVDMLGELGYRVLKAEDGESALAILQSGAAIDLLFTDVIMPGPVRSPDMARRAQELLPDIAVLFTSGYAQNEIVHGGRLDAGVELLSKPYRRDELAAKLRHVLAARQRQMLARQTLRDEANLKLTDNSRSALAPAAMPVSLKILVVEDNLDSQQMVCELIGMLGHTVSGVSDGETALQLLQEQDFDILFTDISLPGMSGIALARLVQREQPRLRIIFSTGYGKEALDQIGFPVRVLRKPYDLMELKEALDA